MSDIISKIKQMAEAGLGVDDICVRLKLTPAERNVVRDIVLKRLWRKAEVA